MPGNVVDAEDNFPVIERYDLIIIAANLGAGNI